MRVYVNLIVAASNLTGLVFSRDIPHSERWFIYLPMLASVLYHLAEVKHGLPGVYPLNLYAGPLLWVDRLFAAISACIVGYALWYQPKIGTLTFWIVGIVGLVCLALSERDTTYRMLFNKTIYVSEGEYLFTHSTWHICAFYCLSQAIRHSS